MNVPVYLSHYFDREKGPFLNILDLPSEQRREVENDLRNDEAVFNSLRPADYLETRMKVERWLRLSFRKKGGKPKLDHPRYLTLGDCSWMLEWFRNGHELKIPIWFFDKQIISFTYPDSIVSFQLAKTHLSRGCYGQVFTMDEITDVIKEYGLPGERKDLKSHFYEKYIEVQIWDNRPLNEYLMSVGIDGNTGKFIGSGKDQS